MPTRSKSILFFALVITAIVLIAVKVEHVWHFFAPPPPISFINQEQKSHRVPPLDREAQKIQDNLDRQRREIEKQTAELLVLSAEIDDKLSTLREAEENILRLIEQKEDLAAALHQAPDKTYQLLYQDSLEGEENKWQEDGIPNEPIIIELAPADE